MASTLNALIVGQRRKRRQRVKKILFKILSWTLTVLTIAFFCVIACLVVGFVLGDFPIITIIGGLLILTFKIADLFISMFIWVVDKLIKRRITKNLKESRDANSKDN